MAEEKEILQSNYLAYLNEKRLMGSECKGCGNVDLPPRKICSKCLSTDTAWIDLTDMQGILSTFSCVHVGTRRFEARGFNMKNPYAFGIVTFDNGAAIMGMLEGVDPLQPASIKIGMKMKLKFIETESSCGLQVDVGFEPAENAAEQEIVEEFS
ncbi:MAG TPA: OB-fold domain-containing protein [Candidatus Lokiarchaeia archaeon]|nr:OB-fold domain-containing protein [Candidatus Lokiarchaeia archaeon]